MALNLKVERPTRPWVMSPYLPLDPFSSHERPRSSKKGAATTPVQTFTFFQLLDSFSSRERPRSSKKGRCNLTSVSFHFGFNLLFSLAQGKCIASLQADPAEDSLCLASFYCATRVQSLELDLRFCDGKLNCYYCCTASPYLPLDPFSSPERPRSCKKGAATSVQTFTFFQVLDPLLRPERPRSSKKGRRSLTSKRAATWFFSVPWPHIEALLLSALSVPVCLCACQGCFLLGDPFPE